MSQAGASHSPEFWRLPRVVEITGLSKSEIYRQIHGSVFPASRAYKNALTRRFWISTEVQRWQVEQVGEGLWSLLVGVDRQADEYDEMFASQPVAREDHAGG